MLEIDSISVYYDKAQILRNVSLRIKSGEVVSIIGGNGAGKTTLLRTISGLLKPASGSISFLGQPMGFSIGRAVLTENIRHLKATRGWHLLSGLLNRLVCSIEGTDDLGQIEPTDMQIDGGRGGRSVAQKPLDIICSNLKPVVFNSIGLSNPTVSSCSR